MASPRGELVDGVLGAIGGGEAELALSSGRLDLLLAGPRTDPSILALARQLEVPVVASADAPEAQAIVGAAVKSHDAGPGSDFDPDAAQVGEGTVVLTAEALASEMAADPGAGLAVLGGWDTPQQSMGWVASEVAPALGAADYRVAGFGDAALWMVKGGLGADGQARPVRVLDAVRGALLAIEAVGDGGALSVCYTGLRGCRDLAEALGLASLGARVCMPVRFPYGAARGHAIP